ncbi:MAG: DUF4294 domain-containing protein [Taibaiella sp.]|nr:DUF4294 domain-containing protein [Taibaiella sp.]
MKNPPFKLYLFILTGILSIPLGSIAQDGQPPAGNTETIKAKIIGDDTFFVYPLENVDVYATKLTPEQQKYWWNLRNNVIKVYPYSILASRIIEEIDRETAGMSKKERKKYLKAKEKDLKDRYKTELKNLTMTQGKILVKLINRHTGRDAYSLIKELKGGVSARLSQTGAFFFDNNLKSTYDPYHEDKDIETIVREIESQGKFR